MISQRIESEVELDWQDKAKIIFLESIKICGQGALFALGSHMTAKIIRREKTSNFSNDSKILDFRKVN